MLETIRKLSATDYLSNFCLVGGTALALYMGHRKSIDIDLFSTLQFNAAKILENLERDYRFSLDHMEKNTLSGSIKGIKVDLITHAYPELEIQKTTDGIRISGIRDIAAMKINAISVSGERVKDFIDIYYLLDSFSIAELLQLYGRKYSHRNPMHAIKSLVYFDNIDQSDWPELISEPDLKWETIKTRIERACNRYISDFLDQNGR